MCVKTVPFWAGEGWPGHSRAVMAERWGSEEVKPRNVERSAAECAVRPENRTDLRTLEMRGAVCAFELVRGSGDAEVTRLAELQHGHIHVHQLRAAGIGRNALARRVRSGLLHATLSPHISGRSTATGRVRT